MGFEATKAKLTASPKVWAITGAAGFIGSNLLEALLRLNQRVVGLENFSTGHRENLADVQAAVGPARWEKFRLVKGDICNPRTCRDALAGVDYVLHHAALASVPQSMAHPDRAHAANVNGFLNILMAARENKLRRVVYASSSSVYGDVQRLPQVEEEIGNCLSPYGLSKRVNELYADLFARCYGLPCVGLRYFNVFGPRQDPSGAYAAVIPKWIAALLENEPVTIYGDGSTTRDFCFVANVIQANILAATVSKTEALNTVYNVGLGEQTTLKQLFGRLVRSLLPTHPQLRGAKPVYRPFRPGDVPHSRASIAKARKLLGYAPTHHIGKGLDEAMDWYIAAHEKQRSTSGTAQPISAV